MLITLVVALFGSCMIAQAGPSFTYPTYLVPNKEVNAVSSYGEKDYFVYTPSVTGNHVFSSTGYYDTYGAVYDANYNFVKSGSYGGTYDNFRFDVYLYANQKYYFVVESYEDDYDADFKIRLDAPMPSVRKDLSNADITLSTTTYTYNNLAKTPNPTVVVDGVTLKKNVDFYVTYSSNKNAGTGKVNIIGVGNYTGTANATFTIKPKQMNDCTVKGVYYTGNNISPAAYYKADYKYYDDYDDTYYTYKSEKKLTKDTDYTISFKGDHKNIGERTAVYKFKGNFTGTVTKKFKILPKKVANLKAYQYSTSQIKVTWNKVNNCTGYKVYRYNYSKGKWEHYKTTSKTSMIVPRVSGADEDVFVMVRTYKNVNGKTYMSKDYDSPNQWNYVKLCAPNTTVSRSDFGEFKVTFKKYGSYQIQVSNNSKFSDSGSKNYCRTYKYDYTSGVRYYNCTSGKKYYVRARKYRYNKSGNLEVGPWCKTKTVTPY